MIRDHRLGFFCSEPASRAWCQCLPELLEAPSFLRSSGFHSAARLVPQLRVRAKVTAWHGCALEGHNVGCSFTSLQQGLDMGLLLMCCMYWIKLD